MLHNTDQQYLLRPCSSCSLQSKLGFSTTSSSFLPLTFLLTGSDLDVLQVLSIVTKRLSRQASSRMFSLFLYATFSPFFSFGFFMPAGTSFLLFEVKNNIKTDVGSHSVLELVGQWFFAPVNDLSWGDHCLLVSHFCSYSLLVRLHFLV